MSIQDTTNCPALHWQHLFASREGTSFKPCQWSKHTLVKWTHHSYVDSWPQHVAEHEMTVKKKKKGQNCPIKYFQHVAPDFGPSLATALIIITPILPFICPARRSVVVSAHSPDVAQNRPQCSFLVLTIWGGSEGSTGSITGLEEPSWMDKRMLCGKSECFTATSSSHLDAFYEALPLPLGGKNLKISTTSFKPILPCKTNYKECLHRLYSERP